MGYRHHTHHSEPRPGAWRGRGRRPGFDSGFSGGPGFGLDPADLVFGLDPADLGLRGRRGGPGGRARRGDVRAAILGLLGEEPGTGYALIKRIQERSEGAWRPSPGSIYPTLQQLVDEGLVTTAGDGRSSEYALTDAGRAHVAEHAEEIARAWEFSGRASGRAEERAELLAYRESASRLIRAIGQFARESTPAQRSQAVAKMDELRKSLYGLLAE